LATRLALLLGRGDLVVLDGELGAGKTFFARAVLRARGLPASERVTSPTFTLIQEYRLSTPVAHADLYRLEQPADLRELGLRELRDRGALLIVEWGAPWVEPLGGDALTLRFEVEPRTVHITSSGPRSAELLRALGASGAPV
jgi:tRNA threonylcarbamoyladenosine biosynthesis protein TsaE